MFAVNRFYDRLRQSAGGGEVEHYSSLCYGLYVNGLDGIKVNAKRRSLTNGEWWAKVVKDVIRDKELSATAVRVFCELALWTKRGDGFVSRGQRAIASEIGIHQETAMYCLRELSERGHIRIEGYGRRRRRYFLTSPAYWQEEAVAERKAS